jgi:hypothetical protein
MIEEFQCLSFETTTPISTREVRILQYCTTGIVLAQLFVQTERIVPPSIPHNVVTHFIDTALGR